MPYKSQAQQRFAHTDTAKAKGFPTAEFDRASKGMSLPKRAKGKKSASSGKSMRSCK